MKRWLPVPYNWVAADGAHYAYTDAQSRVHLVTVADGSDQILAAGAIWGIYSYGINGIYAGQRDVTKQPSLLGLWRISPTGGAPAQLTPEGTWLAIDAKAAWSVEQDASAPHLQAPEESYGSVLKRFDLQSGQVSTWYTSASGDFRVATIDTAGRPVLVSVHSSAGSLDHVWIVTSAGVAQTIGGATSIIDVMADSHGVWYVDAMTISIYLVRATAPESMGQYGFNGLIKFAGPCQ
ncbi:MAG TPA: hypothetical protein VF990_00480 [Candidatus Dormibacteraeota bacterium]